MKKKNDLIIYLIALILVTGFISYGIYENLKETTKEPEQVSEAPKYNADATGRQSEITTGEQENNQVLSKTVPTPAPSPSSETLVEETGSDHVMQPVKVKGIYVSAHTAGTSSLEDLIRLAGTTEINAMVIDVKDDHGKISYRMDCEAARNIGAVTDTIPDIKSLIHELKKKGIYLIARMVAFKDPYLASQRKDLAIKNTDGTIYRDKNGDSWVNPYQREVWDYLLNLSEQAALDGFDEIQFDYIRFSTGSGMKQVSFGDTAKNISKEEIIAGFTKYAYEHLKPLGVYVSADVYGTIISSTKDASLVGQNYKEMAKYLDYICPMIYPSHFSKGNYGIEDPDLEPYNIVRKVLEASKEKLDSIPEQEHKAIVRPWLQDFTATWISPHIKYGGIQLRDQINGVYSADYDEWLLWNSGSRYSEDGLIQE